MLAVGVIILVMVASSTSTENCSKNGGGDCAGVTGTLSTSFNQDTDWSSATSIYQFHAKNITGDDVSMEKYRGHVLIIVNVASKAAMAGDNYQQLESLYEKYGASKGLRILAFPTDQFGGMEFENSSDILNFVKKYNVTFDIFDKVYVNGDRAHPLWKWLKKMCTGFITKGIKWHFTKFIVDKHGQVVLRFGPLEEPKLFEYKLPPLF